MHLPPGISIHAPRTGSDSSSIVAAANTLDISIHAPRTGSDAVMALAGKRGEISIHAPRTGSDPAPPFALLQASHFNPRSPHGERRSSVGPRSQM